MVIVGTLTVVFVVIVIYFVFLNVQFVNIPFKQPEYFKNTIGWPHSEDSLAYAEKSIIYPSSKPYNLLNNSKDDYTQYGLDPYFVETINKKRNGFFVELGAYDGEHFSNTLHLELMYNWTGLLIEPQVHAFNSLVQKQRKAYLLHACILNVVDPIRIDHSNEGMQVEVDNRILTHKIAQKVDGNSGFKKNNETICLPFSAIVQALNIKNIDYFSLDVERTEPEVLMSIPWDKVNIDIFQIECVECPANDESELGTRINRKQHFVTTYMETHGYKLIKKTLTDVIYRKVGSSIPRI